MLGDTLWTAVPASWIFDGYSLCPGLQPRWVTVSGPLWDASPTGKGKEERQIILALGTFPALSIRNSCASSKQRVYFDLTGTQSLGTGQVSFLPLATGKLRAK